MKKFLVMSAVILATAMSALSQTQVGSKVDNFSLPDTEGKMQSLADMKGANGAVIIFVSAQCPVVRGYNERMNELAKTYKAKGVNVIGVDSNVDESASDIKAHAMTTWDFPVLIDKDSKIADKLGAHNTPESFFVDSTGTVAYHGAIDDSRTGTVINRAYLINALEARLAGKKVELTQANAFGCTIKRPGQ